MTAVIRTPVTGDVDALAACHVRCWREAYAGLLSPGFLAAVRETDRAQLWRRLVGGPEAAGLAVATVGDEVVGFAGVRAPQDDPPVRPVELWGLYLHAERHGSGLGQDLLDAVLPVGPASLWVAEHNPRARAFYARNGFTADGVRQLVPAWEDLPIVRLVR